MSDDQTDESSASTTTVSTGKEKYKGESKANQPTIM